MTRTRRPRRVLVWAGERSAHLILRSHMRSACGRVTTKGCREFGNLENRTSVVLPRLALLLRPAFFHDLPRSAYRKGIRWNVVGHA